MKVEICNRPATRRLGHLLNEQHLRYNLRADKLQVASPAVMVIPRLPHTGVECTQGKRKEAQGLGWAGLRVRVRGMEIGSRERAKPSPSLSLPSTQIVSETTSAKTRQDPRRKGGPPWVVMGPIGRAGQCRAADSPTPVRRPLMPPAGDPRYLPSAVCSLPPNSSARTTDSRAGRGISAIAVPSNPSVAAWVVLSDTNAGH